MSQVDNVISIKDLFAELVRKCGLIILCIIVFAVALGGYKYVQATQSQESTEVVEGKLTEEQEEAVLEYVAAAQAYESLEEYYEDSILFQCNPYNVYQTELQYIITGDVDEDDIATIRAAYADYALFGRLATDMAEDSKKYTQKVLSDIIDTDYLIREQDNTLKTVRIMIVAPTEKATDELVKSAKEQIADYSEVVKETIGAHEFSVLVENTVTMIDTDLIWQKEDYENKCEELENDVETLEAGLDAVQMKYAKELLGEIFEDTEDVKEGISLKSILKFAILGAAVGAVLAIVIIVILYFFSNQMKTAKEIEYVYEIVHLGNCSMGKRNVFEQLSDKIFYSKDNFDVEENKGAIITKIAQLCEKENINNIYFTGRVEETAMTVLADIIAELEKKGVKAKYISEAELLENNPTSANVIRMETIRKTSMQDVKEKIELYRENNLTISGYITFSK